MRRPHDRLSRRDVRRPAPAHARPRRLRRRRPRRVPRHRRGDHRRRPRELAPRLDGGSPSAPSPRPRRARRAGTARAPRARSSARRTTTATPTSSTSRRRFPRGRPRGLPPRSARPSRARPRRCRGRSSASRSPSRACSLPGWFCPAARSAGRVVISVGGYDSTAEESYFWNGAAARRARLPRGDVRRPRAGRHAPRAGRPVPARLGGGVSAVIDAVAKRPDVDADRIVIIGESFGGYLAPRAAARDRRIAACVLDPAQIGPLPRRPRAAAVPRLVEGGSPRGPRWLVALLRVILARMAKRPAAGWALRRGMLTHGVATPWDYFVEAARYEGADLVPEIRCPTLVCDAVNDDISASAQGVLRRADLRESLPALHRGGGRRRPLRGGQPPSLSRARLRLAR